MNTDVPILTIVGGFPNELLYPIFRLVISTKYVTLPDFCNFISRNCLEFDPFTNLCSLVIRNSVAVLADGMFPYLMIEIEQGVQSPKSSVHFCETPIFINFIEVLTRFHIKFQKLHIGNQNYFPILPGITQSVFQIFINNKFLKSCCKELHINHCGSDIPDSHLGSLCPYSRIVKTLAIRMTHQDLKYLPNFLNVELLGINYGDWTDDDDDDDDDDITPLKDWINMISGMKIKRKVVILIQDQISRAFINLIIETVSKHELIDIKITARDLSPTLVNTLKPVKDYMSYIQMYNKRGYFDPSLINSLNSYPCLNRLELFRCSAKDFVDAIDNRNINELEICPDWKHNIQYIPVKSLENLKDLKSLMFYTASWDLSKLKLLKSLRVGFAIEPDTSTSLLLPPNLESLDCAFMGNAPIIEIANRNCLKRLRKVSLTLRWDSPSVEPTLMLMKCLPTSVTSLSFSLSFCPERSVQLNLAHLVKLETLIVSSSDGMELEIREFPKYLRSLSILVHLKSEIIVPYFPKTLLHLDLTCPLERLGDYNANNLEQLSCLTIQTSGIGYIDLRKIIPDSLLYCSLSLKHDRYKDESEGGNESKCTIELPFQSHPNLKFLLVQQDLDSLYEEMEVCFQGEMSECDKSKLKLVKINGN